MIISDQQIFKLFFGITWSIKVYSVKINIIPLLVTKSLSFTKLGLLLTLFFMRPQHQSTKTIDSHHKLFHPLHPHTNRLKQTLPYPTPWSNPSLLVKVYARESSALLGEFTICPSQNLVIDVPESSLKAVTSESL